MLTKAMGAIVVLVLVMAFLEEFFWIVAMALAVVVSLAIAWRLLRPRRRRGTLAKASERDENLLGRGATVAPLPRRVFYF